MKIDVGILGKIIGWAVGIILLGALATTGLGVLVGKGMHDIPLFVADTYYGFTGETFVLDQSTELLGLKLVNKDWKFLGVFPMDGPYKAGLSEGAQGLSGGGAPKEEASLNWEEPTEAVPPAATDESSSTPTPVDETLAACNLAAAKLKSLKGVGTPYEIRDAANEVLRVCINETDVATATNALAASQKAISEKEAADAEVANALKNWALITETAAQLPLTDAEGARTLVGFAGGSFYFSECEVWAGALANVAGGGESCTITLYPNPLIEDQVTSVSFAVELQTLWDWGLGDQSSVLDRIPEAGVYTLP